jgi:predicted transcriptional regulator of viral defense system
MNMKYQQKELSPSAFVDRLQANGRYSFTLAEMRAIPGRTDLATRQAIHDLKRQGRIASPRSGFYVIVPLEYKLAGAPPASWFIDELMRHFGQPYYVSLLSAAALQGAGHQQPMVFQVVTDRLTRPAKAGRVRMEFHVNRMADKIPVEETQTETGRMRVSTPEATAFDLVRYARASGGLGNVATVLKELSGKIRPEALAAAVPLYALADAQRLGYLLESVGKRRLTGPLQEVLVRRRLLAVPLAVGRPTAGHGLDARWKIIINENVEADL